MRADHGEQGGLGDEPASYDLLEALPHLLDSLYETDYGDCQRLTVPGDVGDRLGICLPDVEVGEMGGGFLVRVGEAFEVGLKVLFHLAAASLFDPLDLKAPEDAVVDH